MKRAADKSKTGRSPRRVRLRASVVNAQATSAGTACAPMLRRMAVDPEFAVREV